MLKHALSLAFIFTIALQCLCQPLTVLHKDIEAEINNLNDSLVDTMVYNIYDNIEIDDSLNLFGAHGSPWDG